MDLLFCHTDIARSPLSHIVAAEGSNVLLDVYRYLDSRRRDNLRVTILSALEPILRCLPHALQTACNDMIGRGELPTSAAHFAHRLGMNPRTADRSMSACGLGSMHRIIAIAQVLRAYELLQHPNVKLTRVATQVGFTSVRPLAKLVHAAMGVHVRSLRETIDLNRLVPPILAYLSVSALD